MECKKSIISNNSSHLKTIDDRLNNPKLSKLEKTQRKVFIDIVKKLPLDNGKVLSLSCGNGVWDYLLCENNSSVNEMTATDIVNCPVSIEDQGMLKEYCDWNFVKVKPSERLPFEENSFDFIFHHDVIEHTEHPYKFLKEQFRVLNKGGTLLCGTPNLFRPGNIIKLLSGRLKFPVKIGYNEEIGDYIHVQEFHEQQLKLLLREVGFTDIKVKHCYFGLSFTNICFSMYPKNNLGKSVSHFLIFTGKK